MTYLFGMAMVLGFLFNAHPGPIMAETLRRGLRGGFYPALGVQIGSLVGDLVWAVVGLSGAAALFTLPHVRVPLTLVGIGFMLWLAWEGLRDARAPMPEVGARSGVARFDRAAVGVGVAISLGNPTNITGWAVIGSAAGALSVDHPGWGGFATFIAGFMAASVLWCLLVAVVVAITAGRLGPRAWRTLNLFSAVGMALYALYMTATVVTG